MDNISWSKTVGNLGNNKQDFDPNTPIVKEQEKEIISLNIFTVLKEELVSKCNELSKMINDVYNIKSTKELYDSVVLIYALEKSLNLIHIKESLVDKVIKKEEV